MTVKAINRELLNAKNSRDEKSTQNKFTSEISIEQKGFLKVTLKAKNTKHEDEHGKTKTIRTYQGTIEVDEQKMLNSGQLDGFWMIVTNHTETNEEGFLKMTSEEVITPYKDKVVIESAFRDIKSFLDIKPIHVWTIEHVKAHYTICVLAYLLDRTLTLRLHDKPGDCSKGVVAHPRLYSELKKCLANHNKIAKTEKEWIGLTQPTNIQHELLERIGLTRLLKKDLVEEYFMKTGV